MKIKLKKTLIATALLSATSTVMAETHRFVLVQEVASQEQGKTFSIYGTHSSECVEEGNASWCLPLEQQIFSTTLEQQSNMSVPYARVIELDTQGYSPQRVAEIINADGRFGVIEVDYPVTSGPVMSYRSYQASETEQVNDPEFQWQLNYFDSPALRTNGMNMLAYWDSYGYERSEKPLDVVVIDSSFFQSEDVQYAGGISTTTTRLKSCGEVGDEGYDECMQDNPPQEPNNDFSPRQENIDAGICTGHGQSVAGVIAASIDNGIGAAGMTNDVRITAIRSMSCGGGFLSDTFNGVRWLLDEPFEGSENLEPYNGNPGVINMSLSSYFPDIQCGSATEALIQRARDAGWVFVASAGNSFGDVKDNLPAACPGVIAVGALNEDGTRADFSNSGEEIDLMAQGVELVASANADDDVLFINGTSFSGPLVAGAAAILKKHTSLGPDAIELALKATATNSMFVDDCALGECGAGVPNVTSALEFAERLENGELDKITFALADDSECEQIWFTENFTSLPLCSLFKVEFNGGFGMANSEYELFRKEKAASWDVAETLDTYSNEVNYVRDIDFETFDYGYRLCLKGTCENTVIELSTVELTEENRPSQCSSE